jgi:hypothetical protein
VTLSRKSQKSYDPDHSAPEGLPVSL